MEGGKFLVGNSQFHFLRRGHATQEKTKRKFGECALPPNPEGRGQEARVGCGWHTHCVCLTSVAEDRRWPGAAPLMTEGSRAAGTWVPPEGKGSAHHCTQRLEWRLSQRERLRDNWPRCSCFTRRREETTKSRVNQITASLGPALSWASQITGGEISSSEGGISKTGRTFDDKNARHRRGGWGSCSGAVGTLWQGLEN